MDICKTVLESLRKSKCEKDINCHYPMFCNDKFNSFNWDGGDDIIRKYFEDNIDADNETKSWIIEEKDYEKKIHNIVITLSKLEESDKNGTTHIAIITRSYIMDTFIFVWNNRKLSMEKAFYNGDWMTEEKYIIALNLIGETGYDLGAFPWIK